MNYIDYLIGLGAGILLTVMVRAVTEARREEREAKEKEEYDQYKWRQDVNFQIDKLKIESGNCCMRLYKLEKRK